MTYSVSSCDFIDEDVANVSKHVKGHVILEHSTNIFIVSLSTAHMHLKLYDLIDTLQGHSLCHDTDSVVLVRWLGDWEPLLDDYLGNLISSLTLPTAAWGRELEGQK